MSSADSRGLFSAGNVLSEAHSSHQLNSSVHMRTIDNDKIGKFEVQR